MDTPRKFFDAFVKPSTRRDSKLPEDNCRGQLRRAANVMAERLVHDETRGEPPTKSDVRKFREERPNGRYIDEVSAKGARNAGLCPRTRSGTRIE